MIKRGGEGSFRLASQEGLTLLEIVVVIVIVGILAVIGLTQYGKIAERSRGSEPRSIFGDIRKAAAGHRLEYGSLTPAAPAPTFDNALANIGPTPDQQMPGPAAADCRGTHFFYYSVQAMGPDTLTITATRCMAGGKNPQGTVADTLTLTSNLSAGTDIWGGTGNY